MFGKLGKADNPNKTRALTDMVPSLDIAEKNIGAGARGSESLVSSTAAQPGRQYKERSSSRMTMGEEGLNAATRRVRYAEQASTEHFAMGDVDEDKADKEILGRSSSVCDGEWKETVRRMVEAMGTGEKDVIPGKVASCFPLVSSEGLCKYLGLHNWAPRPEEKNTDSQAARPWAPNEKGLSPSAGRSRVMQILTGSR